MTPTLALQIELDKHPFALRRQFNRLPDERREEVTRRFARHRAACDKAQMDTDREFLPTLIHDLKKGFEL